MQENNDAKGLKDDYDGGSVGMCKSKFSTLLESESSTYIMFKAKNRGKVGRSNVMD